MIILKKQKTSLFPHSYKPPSRTIIYRDLEAKFEIIFTEDLLPLDLKVIGIPYTSQCPHWIITKLSQKTM